MNSRERLPNRRASTTFAIELHGLRFTASVSRFADGRIADIFLQNHKPGSQSDAKARDSAVAASLARQFGCPPKRAATRGPARSPRPGINSALGAALDLIKEGNIT